MAKGRIDGQIFRAAKGLGGKTSRFLGLDKMSAGEKAMRFGMDGVYATMGAIGTPGDLGDKLIAGGGDFLTSAGSGILGAAPFKGNPNVAGLADNIGSLGGWQLGQPVIEGTMRAKDKVLGGEGLSAYERASQQYDQQLTNQVLMDLDAAGLLTPEARMLLTNDNTGMV